jgi:hypothetical protein
MFPEQAVADWLDKSTRPGQTILDPFSGRGTAPFQALLMDRKPIGADINPVAFVLTGAKVDCPAQASVNARLRALCQEYDPDVFDAEREAQPTFFKRAFHHTTLRQLLYLRESLDWKQSRVDRFITALALGSLHGEKTSQRYFSNQMPRTISTKPAYSLKYWRERNLWPDKRDVFEILRWATKFRYKTPPPEQRGSAYLSDIRSLGTSAPELIGSVDCVVTSPPYFDVTNFEEDQWLRLWFLGGPPHPTHGRISTDDRYGDLNKYWAFLCNAWQNLRPLLKNRSTFICRIGGRSFVAEALQEAFTASTQFLASKAKLCWKQISYLQRRQTDHFRPGTTGCRFELDLCFDLRQ